MNLEVTMAVKYYLHKLANVHRERIDEMSKGLWAYREEKGFEQRLNEIREAIREYRELRQIIDKVRKAKISKQVLK